MARNPRLLALAAMAKSVHGYGYRSKLARGLGVSPSSVSRWLSGVVTIPRAAELCIVVQWQMRVRGIGQAEGATEWK